MPRFCGHCGSRLDVATGLCPRCDADAIARQQAHLRMQAQSSAPVSKPPGQTQNSVPFSQSIQQAHSAAQTNHDNHVPDNEEPERSARPRGSLGHRITVFLFVCVVLLTLLLAGSIVAYRSGLMEAADTETLLLSQFAENDERTVQYESGDYIYTPASEHIRYDAQENRIFYDNQLVVCTLDELSDEDAAALAAGIGGTVVGRIGSVNTLQIQVDSSDWNTVQEMVNQILQSDEVLYAAVDMPIQIETEAADSNPWNKNKDRPAKDRGNESSPGGNDWWAEAIGAYTAWEYRDQCEPITVGIVDTGFDTDHEDLQDTITILPTDGGSNAGP